jgi:hypothetical protein
VRFNPGEIYSIEHVQESLVQACAVVSIGVSDIGMATMWRLWIVSLNLKHMLKSVLKGGSHASATRTKRFAWNYALPHALIYIAMSMYTIVKKNGSHAHLLNDYLIAALLSH